MQIEQSNLKNEETLNIARTYDSTGQVSSTIVNGFLDNKISKIEALMNYKYIIEEEYVLKIKKAKMRDIIIEGLNLSEGTNDVMIGEEEIKVKQTINRKVDYDNIVKNALNFTPAMQSSVKFSAALTLPSYRKLSVVEKNELDKYITSKPATPSIVIGGNEDE